MPYTFPPPGYEIVPDAVPYSTEEGMHYHSWNGRPAITLDGRVAVMTKERQAQNKATFFQGRARYLWVPGRKKKNEKG